MSGKSILIVDDEAPIREMIAVALEMAGYTCLEAENTQQAHACIVDRKPDLILLDWMLPGTTGIELARRLKRDELTADIPIIMLTAKGDEASRIHGLEQGADDYLAKPFKFIELIARVKSLLRRSRNFNSNIPDNSYRFSDIKVNDSSKTVTRNGKKIALTSTEYKLLLAFLKAPGRVISRTELLENVWGVNYDIGTNVVDVYVNYLRKKLEKENNDRLIHTVIGMGYVLKEDDEDTE